MITGLLGIKKEQSQAFDQDGKRIAVTVVAAGPCWVTSMSDRSIQLGFGAGRNKNPRFLRSVRIGDVSTLGDVSLGKQITVGEVFAAGDSIRVTGLSKGKGFAGAVKRHGFAGGPKTHGQSDRHRAPGAIGSGTTPGRVYRGKRMAGRMGGEKVTVRGLHVFAINPESNTLTVKGLVPGGRRGLLIIQKE